MVHVDPDLKESFGIPSEYPLPDNWPGDMASLTAYLIQIESNLYRGTLDDYQNRVNPIQPVDPASGR